MKGKRWFIIGLAAWFLWEPCLLNKTPSASDSAEIRELLTAEELAWINRHSHIRIAGPKAFPPFHWFDEDGNIQGIAADYCRLWLKQIGVSMEVQKNLLWPDVLKKTEQGEIELISCIAKSADREAWLIFGKPYLSFPMVIVSRKDAPFIGGLDDLNGMTIACVGKSVSCEWMKRDGIRFISYPVDTPLQALEAVSTNRVDAHIENLATATYLIEKYGLTNLKIAAPTPYGNYDLHFAVRKDLPELASILNKVLASMTTEQHAAIRNRWLSVRYEHGIRWTDIFQWVFITAGISGCLGIIGYLQYRRLQQEVRRRKESEARYRESEERYRLIFEHAPVGIMHFDKNGTIIECNQTFCHIIGASKEQLIGFNMLRSMSEGPARRAVADALQYGEGYFEGSYHTLSSNKDIMIQAIHRRIESSDGEVLGAISIFEDISEKKKLEAQLYRSQKLEAIGTMAGGIAHDFNNILGIILGNAELAVSSMSEGNPLRGKVELIRTASLRARDVIRQLLSITRGTEQPKSPVHLAPIIMESLTLLRSSIPTTIEIQKNFSHRSDMIMAVPTLIHQILINLGTNAAHAMQKTGGILEISLNNVDIDETYSQAHGIPPGAYVRLRVSDTGHGIPPDILNRIFDPYFTTKPFGEGSGMGLSMVQGIVKSHGGSLSVYSEVGKGTVFHVLFPLAPEEISVQPVEHEDIPGGHESVLVIDDEKQFADLTARMLDQLGYRVMATSDPIEALEWFRNTPHQYDLVITDMTMPYLTGDVLSKELLQIRPDIPIILCTGHNRLSEEQAADLGIKAVLMKPLLKSDIAKVIRQILGNETGR